MTKHLKTPAGFHISLGSLPPPNAYTTWDLECSLKIILFYVVKSFLCQLTIIRLYVEDGTIEDVPRKRFILHEWKKTYKLLK